LKKSMAGIRFRSASLVFVGLLAVQAQAVTNKWQGTDTDWSKNANWDQNHPPQAGEDVLVDGTAATYPVLAVDTPSLASFTIESQQIVFTNWSTTLIASNVTVRNGGVLALPDPFSTSEMSNRVDILCTNFVLLAGGSIDADAKGYLPGNGPGTGASYSSYAGGAGHGGRGGRTYYVGTTNGPAYDSGSAPAMPGSGGGVSAGDTSGRGGGAVRIKASGTAIVSGTITADGSSASASVTYGAGGSGGSIYIQCATFAGTNGLLSADGGNGSPYAGYTYGAEGAGGRIAVDYTGIGDTPTVRFSTAAGIGMYTEGLGYHGRYGSFRRQWVGESGTVWLPDTALLSTSLNNQLFTDVNLTVAGASSWTVSSLNVDNCSVNFVQNGFRVIVANDLTIGSGGKLGVGAYSTESTGTGYVIEVGGDLVVTNGGALYVFAGKTNGTGNAYGALVDVGADLKVASSSWIYPYSHQTDGGSVRFEASDVLILAGGGINADTRGYGIGSGPGKPPVVASTYQGGGGYGGDGGTTYYIVNKRGVKWGSLTDPLAPGSGPAAPVGLSVASQQHHSSNGGGLVWLEATGTVTVQGTISANGGNAGYLSAEAGIGAGGSGGAVYIQCDTFGGPDGLLSVNGGDSGVYPAYPQWYSGGGGGGRIAVHYQTAGSPVRFAATGGRGAANRPGLDADSRRGLMAENGTVYLRDASFLTAPLLAGNRFTGVSLTVSGLTAWAVNDLTVSNCSFTIVNDGFHLTVSNNLLIGRNGSLGIGPCPGFGSGTGYVLTCLGNVTITNGGGLHVYSGRTNGTGLAYGALVDVAGNMSFGTNSWFYPYSHAIDGGSVLLRLANLLIPGTNSGINANGRGYAVTNGPGKAYGAQGAAYAYGPGGGYGGRGGNDYYYGSDTRGQIYGSSNAPAAPGSGSGSWNGGFGGGLVWIEADGTILVNGTIAANGGSWADMEERYGGGGSGGGIYLTCDRIAGGSGGLISADGGDGGPTYDYCGPGGGGRIAAYFKKDTFLGAKSRAKGDNDYVPSGQFAEDGTLVWFQLPPSETLIMVW